ncbi:MAG: dephospho-CoA kinase, partial [Lachnospiraceae bacterium]|nr:dephospho-CoA kinase [Lachnospiraceae bacterium]
MKVIGITGGVGSGKSAVLDYMEEEYGAYILKADELAAKLKEPGNVCYEPLVALLGENVLLPAGKGRGRKKIDPPAIDNAKMAKLIFDDDAL